MSYLTLNRQPALSVVLKARELDMKIKTPYVNEVQLPDTRVDL